MSKQKWNLPFDVSDELEALSNTETPLGDEVNKLLWDYSKLWEEHMLAVKSIRRTYLIAKKAAEAI